MCMTNLLVGRAKEKFTHNLLIVKLTIFFPIQFELMTFHSGPYVIDHVITRF